MIVYDTVVKTFCNMSEISEDIATENADGNLFIKPFVIPAIGLLDFLLDLEDMFHISLADQISENDVCLTKIIELIERKDNAESGDH